jgi:ubiquinone/menaquinone biosynthesis C-methylase UbiE
MPLFALARGGGSLRLRMDQRDSFTQQAAAFEDPRLNRLFTTDSEWLFDRLPLTRDDMVLEVATGTGHVARRLAPRVRAVIGLDATRAMLQRGQREAPANVVFVEGDAARLPFLDHSFDVVVCRFALHHFAEPQIQVGEMRRVLKSGGRLAIADLVAHETEGDEQNRLERLRDPAHERLLTRAELERLVGTDDVEIRDVVRPLEPWLDQTQTPEEVRRQIRASLEQGGSGFRPTQEDGELHFVHTMASLIG